MIHPTSDLFTDSEEIEPNELQKIEINLLLEGLYQMYGYDFRGYVWSSLSRRIMHRMGVEKLPTITALLEKVLHEQGFLERLLNDLSIQMTEMYQDPHFFTAFRSEVVPPLRDLPKGVDVCPPCITAWGGRHFYIWFHVFK
jgi:chemotaxis methyl-accepting protein methylase